MQFPLHRRSGLTMVGLLWALSSGGCFFFAPIASAVPLFLVGDWYCESLQEGEQVFDLSHDRADGTFVTEFRECGPHGKRDHLESGHWSLNGNMLTKTTDIVNGNHAFFVDIYEISANDGHSHSTRIVGGSDMTMNGGATFRETLVSPDSKLPECDQLS